MERTKKIEEVPVEPVNDGIIWWKYIGGGSYRMGNRRMIKPEEKFRAHPNDIPMSIRDVVIPLEALPDDAVKPATVVKTDYKMQPRGKSKSLFDVLDLNGKVLNEKPLSKDVAQKLIKDLES